MEKNKGLWILGIYFFLSIYLLPIFPHGGSASELTNWASAASLVEKGSFDISWTENLIGGNVDAARLGEKSYSNKPPGTAILAAPVYALTRLFVGAPNASNIRITWFTMRFFVSTLPLLLFGLWLYTRDSDEISLAALFFATPIFIYSLTLTSHVLVAVLLYFAFRLLYDTERIFLRNCVAAGFLAGSAVACDFLAIVPLAVFAVGLFFADKHDRFQNIFFLLLGAAPFIAALLIYGHLVLGSSFALFSAYEVLPEMAETGAPVGYSLGVPTFYNLYLLLFSPSRGLFFYAPVLLLPLVTFVTSRGRKTWRHRVKVATVLVTILVVAGHGAAHGGWAFGARYLILILPLMLDSFFDGEIFEFSNVWQGVLFTISFLLSTIPVLTFPFAPPEFKYPHNNFWGKFLFSENWFTPDLANVFGFPSGVWTILPVLISLVVVLFVLRRYARRPSRFTIGMSIGLLMVGIYFGLPNLDSEENGLRRASLAERFYKPANRLEIYKATNNRQTLERIKNLEWLIADARAFAPNDFPYLPTREFSSSPSAELKKAAALQAQGNAAQAVEILLKGKESFPFARCEFAANLAAVYYATERKDAALEELEGVQNMVNPAARPDCLRSQFQLGKLYLEMGETEKAEQSFRNFLANTQNSDRPEIINLREKISVK